MHIKKPFTADLAECGPGWHRLISSVIKDLTALGVTVLQVKEKFGGLRIYTDTSSPAVESIIEAAEELASRTCEQCGKRGKYRGDLFYKQTLCKGCYEFRKQ